MHMNGKSPAQLAKQWLDSNCLILDTETTGLYSEAEICEFSVIDAQGTVLLDTLVKPTRPIPADATAIHGITNEMVADAPSWFEIYQDVVTLLAGRCVVIYNAAYDTRLISQSTYRAGYKLNDVITDLDAIDDSAECAMLAYAEFYGDWDEYHENYRWQRLTNAAVQQSVVVDGKAHRALADCRMTLGVLRAMAKEV
ncbi:exonuclease domain-containing protein [Photobacterium alginatilyticum]|uniref:3'-5' exonuclease n=2 Tax=Photobacterium alginatilyticum TaxID=1775171 RepID=A0ABW9YNT3_9GAMM|nr:3'-5' exonuclease [Photobacterium alginatilyticum]